MFFSKGTKKRLPDDVVFAGSTVQVVFGEGDNPPKISGVAYAGGIVNPMSPLGGVVIDLSGMRQASEKRSVGILFNHGMGDGDQAIGIIDELVNDGKSVSLLGRLLVNDQNTLAKSVAANAKDGYPYEYSIRASCLRFEEVPSGKRVNINGRDLVGPFAVFRESILREISVVHVGADPDTEFSIAASLRGAGETKMETEVIAISDSDTVLVGDITAEWIKENKPEVAASLAAEKSDPVPEVAASIDELSAIFGDDKASAFDAMAKKLSASKARELVASAREAELIKSQKEVADLKSKLELALKGGAPPIKSVGGDVAASDFSAALGTDPEADWEACEKIRAVWTNRDAFLGFARHMQKIGTDYRIDPNK